MPRLTADAIAHAMNALQQAAFDAESDGDADSLDRAAALRTVRDWLDALPSDRLRAQAAQAVRDLVLVERAQMHDWPSDALEKLDRGLELLRLLCS